MNFSKLSGVWHDGAGNKLPTACIQTSSYDREVPLVIAEEAYKEYAARYGTSQSLDRLCERGGFGASELAILLFWRVRRLEEALRTTPRPAGPGA